MHTFDSPVATATMGESLDIKGCRRDIKTVVKGAFILKFCSICDLQDRLNVLEFKLSWVMFLRNHPIDNIRCRINTCFDSSMAFFNSLFRNKLIFWGSKEVICNFIFQRRLIALQGKQEIGFVCNNFIGNLDLTAHGIDRYERSFKLAGCGKMIKKLWNGCDFIGFFRDTKLCQRQPSVGCIGAECVKSFEPLAFVMSAARRLAINGNQIVPTGPERLDPVFETTPEQDRVNAVNQSAKPPLAWNTKMEWREFP